MALTLVFPDLVRDRRTSRRRTSVVGVLAMAALLLLTGCASSATAKARPRATLTTPPTPTASPTPLPAAPLTWRTAARPSDGNSDYAVAPSDGSTAYACIAPGGTYEVTSIEQPHVWITHSAAAHWTRVSNVPADHLNNGCTIKVDQRNPATAIAVLTWMPPGAGALNEGDVTNFVTFDSGMSWRKLTDPHPFEMLATSSSATWNGTIYAIRNVLIGNVGRRGLWASSDQMTTWRSIDPSGVGAADAATFWMAPISGDILAAYGEPEQPKTLWETPDGGAHWKQVFEITPASTFPSSAEHVAWSPGPNKPWTICDKAVGVTGNNLQVTLMCSLDGGVSWQARPNITPPPSASGKPNPVAWVFAIASDGALLATVSSSTPNTQNTLYRLSVGASQWQSLGDMPVSLDTNYVSSPGRGIIWTDPSGAPAIANYP